MESKRGKILVGRRIGSKDPKVEGYYNVVALTPSTKYASLSPYLLKSEKGYLIENLWQFSKIYNVVPKSTQRYSQWDKTIIWDHPSEVHIGKDGQPTDAYWDWRKKGFKNKYPVRYPVGRSKKNTVNGSIYKINGKYRKFGYVKARKRIYIPEYTNSVRKEEQFKELKNRLKKGQNLLIIDVDGPHYESMEYYNETYDIPVKIYDNHTVKVTEENLNFLLNEPKHPFGHGYCLAAALLNIDLI